MPGGAAPSSSVSWTRSAAGREGSSSVARRAAPAVRGPLHGLPARHRRPAAGVRVRRLRGLRGAHVRPARPTTSWTATSTRTCAPCATSSRRADIEAGLCEPRADGPGDPRARPRRRAVRGEDPRLGARVHAEAPLQAVRAVRERGPRAGAGGAGRLAAHRREPVGGDAARRPARAHLPRPARRRHAHVRAARAGGGAGRASTRSCAGSRRPQRDGFGPAAAEGDRRALRPAPRQAAVAARSWPRCARATTPPASTSARPTALAALDPDAGAGRLLRRQADRLEGHRPAAGRLAAACWRASRARSSSWSASAPTARASRCCCAGSSARTSAC